MISAVGANCPQPCKLPEEQASMKTKTHSTPLLLPVSYTHLDVYKRQISIFKSIGDSISIALCYNDRGIIHYSMNEFNTAEQFLKQALIINRSQKNLRDVYKRQFFHCETYILLWKDAVAFCIKGLDHTRCV